MITAFIRELWNFILRYLVRPPALLAGALLTSVYNVLFAWWLDEWTFKGRQARFEQDIRKEHSWIFEKYGAAIVPMKRYRQVLNYRAATVAVDDLVLQFVKGMEDAHVTVAPAHAPHDWYRLEEAIALAHGDEPSTSTARYYHMSDFQRLFETNFASLKAFFSKEHYRQSRRDRTAFKLIRL
jgi:hypothetical protein